jgi:hypothetical protein
LLKGLLNVLLSAFVLNTSDLKLASLDLSLYHLELSLLCFPGLEHMVMPKALSGDQENWWGKY